MVDSWREVVRKPRPRSEGRARRRLLLRVVACPDVREPRPKRLRNRAETTEKPWENESSQSDRCDYSSGSQGVFGVSVIADGLGLWYDRCERPIRKSPTGSTHPSSVATATVLSGGIAINAERADVEQLLARPAGVSQGASVDLPQGNGDLQNVDAEASRQGLTGYGQFEPVGTDVWEFTSDEENCREGRPGVREVRHP